MSPLWWMAFVALAVMAAFLTMVVIATLSETAWVRRVNRSVEGWDRCWRCLGRGDGCEVCEDTGVAS